MEKFDKKLKELIHILTNFKKSVNTNYRKETLIEKSKKTAKLVEELNNDLLSLQDTLEGNIFEIKTREIKLLSDQILYWINKKLVQVDFTETPNLTLYSAFLVISAVVKFKKFRMANLSETTKTVSTLMPQYDGSADKFTSVIDALEIIKSLETDANKQTIVGVILTKFDTKVRHSFGVKPESVDAIIASLKETVKKTPPETVIAKLSTCKQKQSLTEYLNEIEALSIQLENAYISKQIPIQVAKDLAIKETIKHMANGLKTEQTKIVLLAGNFNQLSQAIDKVLEINPTLEKSASVLTTLTQNKQNRTEKSQNETFEARDSPRNSQVQGRNESRWQGNVNNQQQFRFGNIGRFDGRGQWTPRFNGYNQNNFRQQRNYFNTNNGYNRSQITNGPRPRYNSRYDQIYQQGQAQQQPNYRHNNSFITENQPDVPAIGQAATVSQTNSAPSQINQVQLQQLAQRHIQQPLH